MIIFFIGFITIVTIVNIGYYEYRVIKGNKDSDIVKAYTQRRFVSKYGTDRKSN